jgi:hypothetical protein
MRARDFLREYTDLGTAKKEILQSINAIDPDSKDEDARAKAEAVLDKIYTVLNKSQVLDRFTSVLPSVLKDEYNDTQVMKIAGKIAQAPLSYQEKMKFTDNLASNKVINPKVLITPGTYTLDKLCYDSAVNKEVFLHLKDFGVGQLMKGPCEHALAILSATISIKGKGDVTVGKTPVEVKAAIGEKKGSGGGRFGETGNIPSRDTILEIIRSYEWLAGPVDEYLTKQASLNVENFVGIVNATGVDTPERKKLGDELFNKIFPGKSAIIVSSFQKKNVDPNEVRKAYIQANFEWYKDSDMGGAWELLAGISIADNCIGVMRTGEDFNKVTTAKKNPAIVTTGKPQEMLFQFNPKLS